MLPVYLQVSPLYCLDVLRLDPKFKFPDILKVRCTKGLLVWLVLDLLRFKVKHKTRLRTFKLVSPYLSYSIYRDCLRPCTRETRGRDEHGEILNRVFQTFVIFQEKLKVGEVDVRLRSSSKFSLLPVTHYLSYYPRPVDTTRPRPSYSVPLWR